MSLLLCNSCFYLECHSRLDHESLSAADGCVFGGVARILMKYHVLLFMSVVVTSQRLNVVYIVVSNCLLSQTTGGINKGITILQCLECISFFSCYII